MALGGQGAPLVPWTDAMLLSHATRTRAVQNIGGIANVTYLPPLDSHGGNREVREPKPRISIRGSLERSRILAFDTGPGNMAIDAAVALVTDGKQRFDKDGRLAAKGTLDRAVFERLKSHPFFARKPPKSTGREDFGIAYVRALEIENRKSKIENLLHTLTRLTAWSIANAYRRFLPTMPDEVILCGGGADNPVLVAMLRDELGVPLLRIDDFGIPNKAKEAASFALLGAATLDGVCANLPSVTGASRPAVLGTITDASTGELR
jgi:anhydro-N-acetylmuramic acid kinase